MLIFIPFAKLHFFSDFTKYICIFRKKAVLLRSLLRRQDSPFAERAAIVAQLVEQRIRNAWVAGLEAEN